MKLLNWLKSNDISQRKFAAMIGVDFTTINKYCSGERLPSRDVAVKIEDITNGEVDIRSWLK